VDSGACQDPNHVFNNAVQESHAKSGFGAVPKAFTAIANMAYGPYWKGVFARQIKETVTDMSINLSPNDALLLKFWPSICADRRSGGCDTDERARKSFLENLPLEKVTPCLQYDVSCDRCCLFSVSSSCCCGCTTHGYRMALRLERRASVQGIPDASACSLASSTLRA
jgi:hypothetical protein